MLIIIEGADGTGKSTLAQGLMKKLKGVKILINYKYPSEKTKEENLAYARGEYEASLRIFETVTDKVWIITDRFHLGEYTYGPIMRGYTEAEARETVRRVEQEILNRLGGTLKVRLIVCYCPATTAWERLKKEEQYMKNFSRLRDVNDRYPLAYSLSILPKFWLNTYFEDPEQSLNLAMNFIENWHRPRMPEKERFIG